MMQSQEDEREKEKVYRTALRVALQAVGPCHPISLEFVREITTSDRFRSDPRASLQEWQDFAELVKKAGGRGCPEHLEALQAAHAVVRTETGLSGDVVALCEEWVAAAAEGKGVRSKAHVHA